MAWYLDRKEKKMNSLGIRVSVTVSRSGNPRMNASIALSASGLMLSFVIFPYLSLSAI